MATSYESIYNLLPARQVVPPKPPMHVSKFPGEVNPKGFDRGVPKRAKGTFGPAKGTSKADQTMYLKKHSAEPLLPEPAKPTMSKTKTKPPVPSKEDRPVMGLVSAKNFVTSNAVENILSQPKKVAGEEMLMTQKPDYGKVPAYLTKVKAAAAAEKELVNQQLLQQQRMAAAGSLRKMSDDERMALIVDLKNKWCRVNEAYQKLPLTLDTPMRKIRKEKYEAELTQLEKDIETLNRKTVLVADDM